MDGIVDPAVEDYLRQLVVVDDPVLDRMERHARERDFPIVGPAVGRFLQLQARAVGARRVFELGSGFGYSAYWFTQAVGAHGEVVCTDLDPSNAEAAERFLAPSGLWDRVRFEVGDALDVLEATDGAFDVIFCDADKDRYPDHWRAAAERVRVGGVYLCDNTLWFGRAATGEPTPGRPGWTEAIREHNRLVADDRRFVSSLVPLRDGVVVALRVA
ncbi:MAG: O-methyltransferase [Actinomycetota bacterium]|nr:O-methyltransferase [Actinomycetota bacterium]